MYVYVCMYVYINLDGVDHTPKRNILFIIQSVFLSPSINSIVHLENHTYFAMSLIIITTIFTNFRLSRFFMSTNNA